MNFWNWRSLIQKSKKRWNIHPPEAPSRSGMQTILSAKLNIIGNLCNMVQTFFKNGHILNRTYITLISKINSLYSVSAYKPLVYVIYHIIIFRILAIRLKKVLSKIISSLELAFIQGRDIHDNIWVARESLNSFSRRRN